MGVGAHVPEEAVYRITKAFWEGVQEMECKRALAAARSSSTRRSRRLNLPLHPGALRYYEEIGMDDSRRASACRLIRQERRRRRRSRNAPT